jgi:hypothetical protein
MTITEWFFLFLAVFGFVCGCVGLTGKEKSDKENDKLRKALQIEHNRKEYFKQRAYRYEHFYDFEKHNKTKEK